MQAIIFCAGKGTRMGALTETTPKSMLVVGAKPILVHKLEALPESIDQVVLVVGYLGEAIKDYFGGTFAGKSIAYVEQENPVGGTGDALWQGKDILKGKFIVMNGDDLYAREDIEKCMAAPEWAMLVEERDPLLSGGKVVVDSHDRIVDIIEGSHEGKGYINAGLYALDERIFSYTPVPKGPGESELGLPQTMMLAAKDISIEAVKATRWIQITAPEDLQKAEEALSRS